MELQSLLTLTNLDRITEELNTELLRLNAETATLKSYILNIKKGILEAEKRHTRYLKASLRGDGEDEQIFINRLKEVRDLYYLKIEHIEAELLFLKGI